MLHNNKLHIELKANFDIILEIHIIYIYSIKNHARSCSLKSHLYRFGKKRAEIRKLSEYLQSTKLD